MEIGYPKLLRDFPPKDTNVPAKNCVSTNRLIFFFDYGVYDIETMRVKYLKFSFILF